MFRYLCVGILGKRQDLTPPPQSARPDPTAAVYVSLFMCRNTRQKARPDPTAAKRTTSASAGDDRALAASEVFALMMAEGSVRAAIRNSPRAMIDNVLTDTFTITYADGGREVYPVEYVNGIAPRLRILSPVPGSLLPGSGQANACNAA
jgi:hypothetical protein